MGRCDSTDGAISGSGALSNVAFVLYQLDALSWGVLLESFTLTAFRRFDCFVDLQHTLFPHKDIHYYTHQLAPRQNQPGKQRVIDYILCSNRVRSSIKDCRVFRGVGGSDHRLLVCTLQLRLSSARQQTPSQHATGPSYMKFAVGRLQQQEVQQQFAGAMHNRFAALDTVDPASHDTSGAEAEWHAFKQATQATAAAELGPQPRRRHQEDLPQQILMCIKQKQEAYSAWQQKEQQWRQVQLKLTAQVSTPGQQPSNSRRVLEEQVQGAAAAATKAKRRHTFLSRLVQRRVEKHRNAQLAAQARKAERQWKAGHLAAFHKTVSKLFKGQPAKAGSQGLLSKDGRSVYRITHEQLQRFTEYFAEVFSGESLTLEQQQHMEQLIQQVETLLQPSTEGHTDDTGGSSNGGNADGAGSSSGSMGSQSSPPSLQEVVDAIAALRDAAAAGADNIAAPLLKANSTMARWLHRVVVAVWMSGRAPWTGSAPWLCRCSRAKAVPGIPTTSGPSVC